MKAVLGLHCLSHDAGAAMVADGRVFAISEERLSRLKYDGGFPARSVRYVLNAAGLKDINDVDLVVFDHIDYRESDVRKWLAREQKYSGTPYGIKHHDAHAASAFYISPFDEAAVLIVDACGSYSDEVETGENAGAGPAGSYALREAQSFYAGSGDGLRLVKRTFLDREYPLGIGILYALASVALGFGELGAGKVMGLAAYGGKRGLFPKSLFSNYDGDVKAPGIDEKDPLRPDNFEAYSRLLFGAGLRSANDKLTNRHAEIAAYVQREAQEVLMTLAQNIRRETGLSNLCMAGGLALNSIANNQIRESGLFDDVFIQPAATDTGIPLGCALYGYHKVLGQPRFMSLENVFLGRSYGSGEIETAAKDRGVKWTRPEQLLQVCAELLSHGKVLGWFQGAAELGPRALGHRSILADPRNPGMKDHLNTSVKHREAFRPYAPVVLPRNAREYFETDRPSPFMLYVSRACEGNAERIPAVLHVDDTARIQNLERQICPQLYDLIVEFDGLTGVPMLLNTSFNDAGCPIVETPGDAIDTFLATGMDYLVLEDILIEK